MENMLRLRDGTMAHSAQSCIHSRWATWTILWTRGSYPGPRGHETSATSFGARTPEIHHNASSGFTDGQVLPKVSPVVRLIRSKQGYLPSSNTTIKTPATSSTQEIWGYIGKLPKSEVSVCVSESLNSTTSYMLTDDASVTEDSQAPKTGSLLRGNVHEQPEPASPQSASWKQAAPTLHCLPGILLVYA